MRDHDATSSDESFGNVLSLGHADSHPDRPRDPLTRMSSPMGTMSDKDESGAQTGNIARLSGLSGIKAANAAENTALRIDLPGIYA